jgi:hypothetical protein
MIERSGATALIQGLHLGPLFGLGSQHRAVVVSVAVISEVPAAQWFIANVGSVPLSLHYVDMGIVTHVSGLHAASILTE